MAAYYIISYDVIDQKDWELYVNEVAKLFPKYGASVLLSDDKALTIEGTSYQINAVVVFPSKELALECYNSKEYLEIKKIRLRSTVNNRIVLASN